MIRHGNSRSCRLRRLVGDWAILGVGGAMLRPHERRSQGSRSTTATLGRPGTTPLAIAINSFTTRSHIATVTTGVWSQLRLRVRCRHLQGQPPRRMRPGARTRGAGGRRLDGRRRRRIDQHHLRNQRRPPCRSWQDCLRHRRRHMRRHRHQRLRCPRPSRPADRAQRRQPIRDRRRGHQHDHTANLADGEFPGRLCDRRHNLQRPRRRAARRRPAGTGDIAADRSPTTSTRLTSGTPASPRSTAMSARDGPPAGHTITAPCRRLSARDRTRPGRPHLRLRPAGVAAPTQAVNPQRCRSSAGPLAIRTITGTVDRIRPLAWPCRRLLRANSPGPEPSVMPVAGSRPPVAAIGLHGTEKRGWPATGAGRRSRVAAVNRGQRARQCSCWRGQSAISLRPEMLRQGGRRVGNAHEHRAVRLRRRPPRPGRSGWAAGVAVESFRAELPGFDGDDEDLVMGRPPSGPDDVRFLDGEVGPVPAEDHDRTGDAAWPGARGRRQIYTSSATASERRSGGL